MILRRLFLLCTVTLALVTAALAAPSAIPSLPEFAGWRPVKVQVSSQPGWGLPAPQAALMKEFGLEGVERAAYQRGTRTIHVEAMFFGDASGAYGAYTFLRPQDYHPFDVGQSQSQGVSGNTDIYFYHARWLMHVHVDELTAMTASEMRALARNLKTFPGQQNQLPLLPLHLPHDNYRSNSVRYIEGPVGLVLAAPWMPASGVGFHLSAEAVAGMYDLPAPIQAAGPNEPDQLVVLSYPTPDIAREYFERLSQALRVGQPGSFTRIRRSGPLLALLHGPMNPGATDLLDAVNYDAVATETAPTPMGLEGLPGLILGIFLLAGMVMAVAIVVGIMTGGLRVFLRRRFPKWFAKSDEKKELIHLDLR